LVHRNHLRSSKNIIGKVQRRALQEPDTLFKGGQKPKEEPKEEQNDEPKEEER